MTSSDDAPDDVPDDEIASASPGPPPLPPARRRVASGSILAAAMFGLRDALENPKDSEPAIVMEVAAGDDGPPRDVDVELDFEHPEHSVVRLRRPTEP